MHIHVHVEICVLHVVYLCMRYFSSPINFMYLLISNRHMACEEERSEIAVILVEHGASLSIQNKVCFELKYNRKRIPSLIQ